MFYTYVLESETKGIVYIGSTQNLTDRISRHNNNRNLYTRGKGPWKLIYSKEFETRSEAIQLERQLKKMKSPERVKNWIQAQSG